MFLKECALVICVTGLYLCHVVYVRAVIQCAYTLDGWNKASVSLQCQEPKYYHCLPDENGRLIQKCYQRILVPKGMCPKFNSEFGQMDVFKCQSQQTDCPSTHFWSNDVLIYYGCYGYYIPITPTTTEKKRTSITKRPSTPLITHMTSKDYDIPTFSDNIFEDNIDSATTLVLVILTVVLGVTILITVIICHIRKRRHRDRIEGEIGEMENLSGNQTRECLHINENPRLSRLLDEKVINALTEKSNLMSMKCPEESRKSQLEDTKGSGISEEGMKSAECTCEVYVASGPNLPQKAEQSDAPQVLMLVRNNPLEEKQVDEHAKKAFGSKYVFCWKMSHYQKHKQKEQALVLMKDFDFKSASVEEILEKLLAVIAAVETRVAFVVAVPLEIWSLNRENIARIEDDDGKLICKTAFV